MASKYRDGHLSGLVFGAVVIASCSTSAPPAEQTDCVYKKDAQGNLVCVAAEPQAGSTGNAGSVGSGGRGIPMLSGGSAGTGIPMLSGGSVGMGGTGQSTAGEGGTGLVATAGTGSVANGATGSVANGATGSVPTAGTDPTGSGGTAGTSPVVTTLGSIIVSAGDKARDHSIVSFPLPNGVGKNLVLKDSQGGQLALQVGPVDTNATFVLPSLAAGAQATFTIEEVATALPQLATATVVAESTGEQLHVKLGDAQVFRWVLSDDNFLNRAPNDVRSGYIYPLYTPGGASIAGDYASDHPHMHGIWSAWTSTTFRNVKVDFWNGYANQGHVDLDQTTGIWNGAVHTGLTADIVHQVINVSPVVTALNEKWIVTVYKTHEGAAPYYVFDIDSTQITAGSDPLILEQYHYGGFGFRGSNDWAGDASLATFLTSEGQNRLTGDGQVARWVAQYGTVAGKMGGYAGLGHPTNFRHPQGIRIHDQNPYWCFIPTTALKGGRYTIEAGVPYHSRFRVVVFDGAPNAALLNQIWDDFATPPAVQVLP